VPSRSVTLITLAMRTEGSIYRISVRYAGEDSRLALRNQDRLDDRDVHKLLAKLDRLDRPSPWTRRTLDLIAVHPDAARPNWREGSIKKPLLSR
jgi:hypothetical protein